MNSADSLEWNCREQRPRCFHHEGHEEHEVRNWFSENFVFFVVRANFPLKLAIRK